MIAIFMSTLLSACGSHKSDLEDFAYCYRVAQVLEQNRALVNISKKINAYLEKNEINMSQFEMASLINDAKNDIEHSKPERWVRIYNSSSCAELHEQKELKIEDLF